MERVPNVAHMRSFGCKAFAHIDKSLRSSLEPTSIKFTFLGYAQYQKAYVLEQEHDKKIVVRRDVTFNEQDTHRTSVHTGLQEDPDPMKIIDSYELEINHNNSEHPTTYREAMMRQDAEQWHKAALER